MFLELGVLLSSIFTTHAIYGNAPSFTTKYNGYMQELTYGAIGPLQYLLTNSTFTNEDNLNGDNNYECQLFGIDLSNGNTTFRNYINVSVNWDIILVNGGLSQQASNISLSLEYMDYDYEFPYLNYYTRAYYTYDNGNNKTYFAENDYHQLWIGETWSYEDLNNNNVAPITIGIEFYWIPESVYTDSLSGAYPGPNDGEASRQIYQNGYSNGYKDGQAYGYDIGYSDGTSYGEQIGYSDGYSDALDQGATASIIFNGIISVGLLPVNVFLRMLNFEVFGINIGAFVSSLLTILVIIIIVRMFLGGKSGSE